MRVRLVLTIAAERSPNELRGAAKVLLMWRERHPHVAHVEEVALCHLRAGEPVDAVAVEIELTLAERTRFNAALRHLAKVGRCFWLFSGVRLDEEQAQGVG